MSNYWITENAVVLTPGPTYGRPDPAHVPGQRFQAVHMCMIPKGPYRGCLLVWDGNLTLVGTRTYQPWAIVNPYPPGANPFVPGGGSLSQFHNALLLMEPGNAAQQQTTAGPGELFCAGQRWTADGRLFLAGGTGMYPPILPGANLPLTNSSVPAFGGGVGMWVGTKFIYQWDPTPIFPSDPYGRWLPMASSFMDARRWYPTVISDGSLQDRFLVLGGTDIVTPGNFTAVNTYEALRVTPNAVLPTATFETKPSQPPATARQFASPGMAQTYGFFPFDEYPRAHALGVLQPIAGGFANRIFVSGYVGQGFFWGHDPQNDPTYSFTVGFEAVPSRTVYSTNVLLPTAPGAIASRIARIGGNREQPAAPFPNQGPSAPTRLVETVVATSAIPAQWSSGGVNDVPNMGVERFEANVVTLPTGDLFAIGGRDSGGTYNLVPELYTRGLWFAQAAHTSPRDYHSTAVLLPDGSVFVGGGEHRTSDYQIWRPQYLVGSTGRRPLGVQLFRSDNGSPISDTQFAAATYGQQCFATWSNALPVGVSVTQAVLMAPAAVTHHDDGGQRCVRLATLYPDDSTPSSMHFLMPPSVRHAPPGWYMMFLITSEGRPGNAAFVNLR